MSSGFILGLWALQPPGFILGLRALQLSGSILKLQASLLHGRINIVTDISCLRGTNIAGTLVPTLDFYPLPSGYPIGCMHVPLRVSW